ncbi:MAG: hypothetical protein PVF85_10645 [Anaerolineales bacterium]|jgi:hypothetical protein
MNSAEPFSYTRIYNDSAGESHFQDAQLDFSLMEFSSHLPPVSAAGAAPAHNIIVLSAPAGGMADWHPVPRKQLNIILSGRVEIEVSDGARRSFGPGSCILGEDTAGRGHITRVTDSEDAYFVVINLGERP